MNKSSMLFAVAVIAFFAMAGFLAFSGGNKEAGAPPTPAAPSQASATAEPPMVKVETVPLGTGYQLVEIRPVLSASLFMGRAAETYRIAAEIPEVVDQLYCYCMCKENPRFKHKTLLTCFTDDHASMCGVCMQEAEMAYRMTREGKSPREIRAAVDKYYQEQGKREFNF